MRTGEMVGYVLSLASAYIVGLVHGRNPWFVIDTIPMRPGQRVLGRLLTNNCAETKDPFLHIRDQDAARAKLLTQSALRLHNV